MRRTGDETKVSGARAALAWLGHPVSVAGIVILLLNDHVLKADFGSWWTGKLSDIAGLVFAPALLAVVVAALGGHGVRQTAIAVRSLATVGVGFVWVKTTAGGAAAATAVWSAVAGPSVVRQDATDLLALPALAVAWWAYTRVRDRAQVGQAWVSFPGQDRVVAQARALVLVPVATLAVAATSSGATDTVDDVIINGDVAAAHVTRGDYIEEGRIYGWWEESLIDLSVGRDEWIPMSDERVAEMVGTRDEATVSEAAAGACLPDLPTMCFRELLGSVSVESSIDGGQTWAIAWSVASGEEAEIGHFHPYYYGSYDDWAGPVAVANLDGGYLVLVAVGPEGMVLREPSGEWVLLGIPGEPEPD